MRLDGKIEKRTQLNRSARSIASRDDGGLWIAMINGLIVLDSDGEIIKKFDRKAKYLSTVPGKNEVWLVDPVNNHVMHLDGDGNTLAEGRLKSLSGLVATRDGGCLLLGRKTAFRLDADGGLVGTLRGLDYSSRVVYQPVDESVWILKSRGRELVELPKEFNQSSLTAIVGLRRNAPKVASADGVKWIPEDQEIGKPEKEKPTTPDVEPDAGKPESQKAESPEKEKPITPDVEREKEEPIEERDEPEVEKPIPPDETSSALEKIDAPEEEKPIEEIEKPEEEMSPSPVEGPSAPGKIEDESIDKPEKEKPTTPEVPPKPVVVPAPPTSSLLSEPPKFENGGVAFVELHEGLSSKRVLNVPQAMGRRYIWNSDNETYTLLLGLSIEAYNSYTNRKRAKWVEMLAEGVYTAKPIADEFRKLADKNGWTAEQTANFVLAFVQSLPYTTDDVATGKDEFPRYALETLIAGGGDCEDTTILYGSILLVLGYDVLALNPEGHLALGVNGKFHGSYFELNKMRYYYSETTGTGWKIGEVPDIYQGVPVTLYEIPKQTKP